MQYQHLDERVVVSVGELRAVELAEGVIHAFSVAEVHHAPAPVVHVGVVHISGLSYEADTEGEESN